MRLLFALLAFMASIHNVSAKETCDQTTKLTIGWQIPWATQGQIVQVWKHTDILADNCIEANFVGRTFGPELNKIAAGDSNALDVILTAHQPALALASARPGEWMLAARLMYNRTPTYMPVTSPIKTVADLAGKTVGVPVGAAAQMILIEQLTAAGVTANVVNLGIKGHAPLVRGSDASAAVWGTFDALTGFDVVPAILSTEGLARELPYENSVTPYVVSVVMMRQAVMKNDPNAAARLRDSLVAAYGWLQTGVHWHHANDWFRGESGLTAATDMALDLAASVEPNLPWGKEGGCADADCVRIDFTADDVAAMGRAGKFLESLGKPPVVVSDLIIDAAKPR